LAVTVTVGGAISGYCSTGKVLRLIYPTSIMTNAIEMAITLLDIKIFPFID
jgi:hypothetical protein